MYERCDSYVRHDIHWIDVSLYLYNRFLLIVFIVQEARFSYVSIISRGPCIS